MSFRTCHHHAIRLCMLLCALLLMSCASGKLHINDHLPALADAPPGVPSYSIYLVGDGGELNAQSKTVMQMLSTNASDDQWPGMVLFTGDNVYPAGMPPKSDTAAYRHGGDILLNQIDPLRGYHGEVIFMPGNHDWNEFKPGGIEAIKRQGEFIASQNDPRIRLLPQHACGDPQLISIGNEAALIIMDSQWWLQDWSKEPDMNKGCQFQTRAEVITWLEKTLAANKEKQLLIALHHPLYSQGTHGGHFTWREHLFPLSKVVKWLYFPLPVIGSIYPYYRSVIGHTQDIRHPNYRDMKSAILEVACKYNDVVFLSGHDHNMQYIHENGQHFLISGAASKQNAIKGSRRLLYGHMAPGYMQLDFYPGAGIHLVVHEINVSQQTSRVVYSRLIKRSH